VIVNSIPSGVLGVARYVDPQTPIASWVVQLGVRQMPADAEALATGRCRIALVRTHNMGEDAPVESWLHANMKFEREAQLRDREGRETSSAIVYFVKAERDDRCSSHAASFHGRASNDPGTPSRPATHTGG